MGLTKLLRIRSMGPLMTAGLIVVGIYGIVTLVDSMCEKKEDEEKNDYKKI
jgi:hypothetical protein